MGKKVPLLGLGFTLGQGTEGRSGRSTRSSLSAESHDRNVSEPLTGPRQTNQRAELTAVQRAIEHVPKNRNVIVVTDSRYSIDCLTNWFQNWRRNNWKTANGKAVENRDLVESILGKIEERERLRVSTKFEWVKGHSTNEGNIAADKLAVEGARQGNASSTAADALF